MEKKFCSACGSELDADGICSNGKCPRRRLQLAVKAKKDAAAQAKSK